MKLHTTQTSSYPGIELVPCTAETEYKIGQGLAITDGAAVIATGTTKPSHICYQNKMGVADETVQAIKVLPGEVFEAELSANGAALKAGDKVTLHTDGIKVTATTASGIAEIVKFLTAQKAAGDKVLVRF